MAKHRKRNSKGRFVRVARSNPPKHHHKKHAAAHCLHGRRPNPPNPHHKKRPRHNPPEMQLIGVPVPDLADVLGISIGFAAPPILQGLALSLAPKQLGTDPMRTIVTAGSWIAPPLIALAFGKRMAKRVFQGELAALGVQLIQSLSSTLQKTLIASPMHGYFAPSQRLLSAYGQRPGALMPLGSYYDPRQLRAVPNFPGRRLPVRLQSRFSLFQN